MFFFGDFLGDFLGHDDIVFEINKQIDDDGPIINTTYFQVSNGQYKRVEGQFKVKLNASKNYKCGTHNNFFNVHIYKANNESAPHYYGARYMDPYMLGKNTL
ncbi:hypothetical protein ACTA71_010622 [Dictyostelium dimigraforme]